MGKWQTTKASTVSRGEIISFDGDVNEITSVTYQDGLMIIDRKENSTLVLDSGRQLEVYR